MFKILDCTLRDGGYYTNWDFDQELILDYFHTMSKLPISYLEVGYRSQMSDGYTGQFYNLPRSTLLKIKDNMPTGPALALMLDAKNNTPADVPGLLEDCKGLIKLIRLAIDPEKLDHGLALAKTIQEEGFEVGLNLMYLSKNWNNKEMYETLADKATFVDYISLVDSFGACYPHQVGHAFKLAKSMIKVPLGFHGHDNLTLAFANAIIAIENGVEVIDSTVLGMGRGAGNLRTEVIAGYLGETGKEQVDLLPMAGLLEKFSAMQTKYGWGTTLPYIIAGFGELPQKDVMSWLSQNRYSTYSIVNAMQGQKFKDLEGGVPHRSLKLTEHPTSNSIIIGGGRTAVDHAEAVIRCAKQNNAIIIHSSVRNIKHYLNSGVPQLLCLLGDEVSKIQFNDIKLFANHIDYFIVAENDVSRAPLPDLIIDKSSTVKSIEIDSQPSDILLGSASPLGTAIGAALALKSQEIWLAGFDGYNANTSNVKYNEDENQNIIKIVRNEFPNIPISSLTPSSYNVREVSVYSRILHNKTEV
ncbi:MAG: hypothetical protein L3J50_04550 [Emcibacter sp.]|nr:hypothetical protein [Emcibacter sp.]